MQQPGLDIRLCNKDGEISRKHGNTLLWTLRKIYGSSFAAGEVYTDKLSEVLHKLDEPALSALVHDHERGRLEQKIAQQT